jgi:hypothetical protein
MTEKTIPETRAEHGREQAEILTARQDAVDEIAAKGSEGVSHRDKLSYGQVRSIMVEEKTAREEGNRTQTREALDAAHGRYEAALSERIGFLKERLYGIAGPDGAAALSRVALASEEELSTMMDIAAQAGNNELAKAAFVAAERKGLGDLMDRFFREVDPEARALYQEWAEIPPAEVLKRQRENLSALVQKPDPDRFIPPARINS